MDSRQGVIKKGGPMEVEELKIQLEQQIEQYRKAKETYERIARRVAILKKVKITTEEAAVLLGVKPRTVRKYHEEWKFLEAYLH